MYIQITNNELTAWGAYPFDDFTKEIPEIDYNDFIQNREKYIFQDENIVLNPNWETEQQTKEKERIARLSCTKRDFVLLLQEQGISYKNTLKPLIETNEQASVEWELCERLYRFNPLLDKLGATLGITPEQLDAIFINVNKTQNATL